MQSFLEATEPQVLQNLIGKALWGYPEQGLTFDRLVGCLAGDDGAAAQSLMTQSVVAGVMHPAQRNRIASFASVCVFYSNGYRDFSVLERVIQLAADRKIVMDGERPDVASWLKALCTRTVSTGLQIHHDLIEMAATSLRPNADRLFALALRYEPDHPRIPAILAAGGAAAACLAHALLEARLEMPSKPLASHAINSKPPHASRGRRPCL